MHNLYFIETNNHELLTMKVKEILARNHLSSENLITYDMEEVNISRAIIDLDTYNLFDNVKVVLCKNATFLTTSKGEIEHNTDLLEKYLNNPNENNILILSCDKCDGKKNIVKLVKQTCEVINTELNLEEFVKEKVKGYKMDKDIIRYFLENTLDDLSHINNEIDKLIELKSDEKEITKEDIDTITIKRIDCNIYELIDAIINKNKDKALKIYNEMINHGEDVFKIFVTLSNQIRLIYQVKTLKNLTNDEICNKLNLKNVKQVVALRYKIDKYTSSDLIDYLHRLSIMDEELKTGKSIDKIVFPVFIASL